MIAVGIPSFNEADNIKSLVKSLDVAALALNEPIIIVNSDNSSQDGTAEIFRSVNISNKKISLTTAERGKGRNVKRIIEYIKENDIDYCFFVDGDVTSMEPDWLKRHLAAARQGIDYVVPNYSRKMQEGNATNHFFFPVLQYFSKGRAPHQPIAGDIGMSLRLAKYLHSLQWHESTLGYGVDIFISMHALFDGFRVVEINLDRKIHKPSYGKMIRIFEEETTSYFQARNIIKDYSNMGFTKEGTKPLSLLQGDPIPDEEIEKRLRYAQALFVENTKNSVNTLPNFQLTSRLSASEWADILVEHEQRIGLTHTLTLAKSLTPFYLLRVTTYLKELKTTKQAQIELAYQASLISERYAQAGIGVV